MTVLNPLIWVMILPLVAMGHLLIFKGDPRILALKYANAVYLTSSFIMGGF